ncbi:hypothetical protein [Nonomuraea soli]|uniref:Cell division protein FtsB n=1 Tax=Nonomuraea soli TaxID=1032476 RepID=A0A7W0CN19_9ACTN|nr:hypothetical protein [Nonomuraea soli]MBA2894136.1 cell division protein FtsB [Nonomuraea soli]
MMRAPKAWMDERYAASQELAEARQEIEALRATVAALQQEVKRLAAAPQEPCALATRTAEALDSVLQNEVLLWQAVDRA